MEDIVENNVVFYLNGVEHTVNSSMEASTTLNTYIRNYAKLKGTKAMCLEGGCGVCIVSVKAEHPITKKDHFFSVNSCLVLVFSCHNWSITTIEGLGDKRRGYHKLQSTLADFNGSQCGFCSPAWIMSIYSLLEASSWKMSAKEIENSFAGNTCRCTGYRPILDAFKSLANDNNKTMWDRIPDIEDMGRLNQCHNTGEICNKACHDCDEENEFCMISMEDCFNSSKILLVTDANNVKWFKVFTIYDIFQILDTIESYSYMLVAGNTAHGVYHVDKLPSVMIDISSVVELKTYSLETNLSIGGGMTLNEVMTLFINLSSSNDYFKYLQQFYNHLDLVAHVSVRNIGTIAGNLMIKHAHNEFPSDVFLLFETVGAVVTLLDKSTTTDVLLSEFLKTDMKGKVILKINLPPLGSDCIFHSYKLMPRAQNVHAHLNAGFLFKFNADSKLVESSSIVYGNINPDFIHATATENYIIGKNIFDEAVLQTAISTLANELIPTVCPPEPTPEFRKKLSLGLLYKCILHFIPSNSINDRFVSGGTEFERPVSTGTQIYDTNKDLWPLNQPIPKIEAVVQCSGEGVFVNDIPNLHDEVYVAFVLSTVFEGSISSIDPSAALNSKGVITFYSAKNIPGVNNFVSFNTPNIIEEEEIFASDKVKFYGQPIGIVVAETEDQANIASTLVKVTYADVPTTAPILTARSALKLPKEKSKLVNNITIHPTDEGKDIFRVINGTFDIFSQYHYSMETNACVCIPTEDGLEVYSSTQDMNMVQVGISASLKIPVNKINVNVRRLGGSYGGKVSRAGQAACACALAAHLLNRPARIVICFSDNISAFGKRFPCISDYEIGVRSDGEIQYLNNTFYQDDGCSHNEGVAQITATYFSNCYEKSRWFISGNTIVTNKASNTACRAPGTTEGVAMIENIMEHISYELGLDPINVRLVNLDKHDNTLPELIQLITDNSKFEERRLFIEAFNQKNRWKKRGISLVPLKYYIDYYGFYTSAVSIYYGDGTVAVSHGGIEMGQGLNTKVAQVCARTLGIPLSSVSIKPSNTFTAPNSNVCGNSRTSELICFATMRACKTILASLEPLRNTLENPTWQELITKAYFAGIELNAIDRYSYKEKTLQNYYVYGVGISEVEVDILTGNHQILRVDILEDVGQSLSPEVDVGQIEGAFVMGIGYWTLEKLIYDKKTGELLTNRTWNYTPPGVKDIPLDFRIHFRKKSGNPNGVLSSKATGEPPLTLAVSVAFALRQAITSARRDAGLTTERFFKINAPYTAENILLAINSNTEDYVLH